MTKQIVAVTMMAMSRTVRPSTSMAERTVWHTSFAQFMGITTCFHILPQFARGA